MRCGDLVLRVSPKVGAVKVLTLLARADGADILSLDNEAVEIDDDADLSAVLARMFVAEAGVALAAGPLRGYRTEDQSLSVLRGRLRIRDQHLRRLGVLSPIEVTVDEWTLDTDENRIIRTAARTLLQLPGLNVDVVNGLHRLDRLLAEANLLVPGQAPPSWTRSRLNVRLHGILKLSELVLAHASIENQAGETTVQGFQVNMAMLFERLVARLLEEVDPAWSAQVSRKLDLSGALTIRPDLVRDGADGAAAVADTKYKILDDAGKIPNADAYQLVTYCARLGLTEGHLIYADGGPPPAPYSILGTDVQIVVHRIDLLDGVAGVESQVQRLHDRVLASLHPTAAAEPETLSDRTHSVTA